MKAYGISDRFLKGRPFKRDHMRGRLKKLGYRNWWEDAATSVNKKVARLKAKKDIKDTFSDQVV